jgi:hypothetical protein
MFLYTLNVGVLNFFPGLVSILPVLKTLPLQEWCNNGWAKVSCGWTHLPQCGVSLRVLQGLNVFP